jgi:hypothetical protein
LASPWPSRWFSSSPRRKCFAYHTLINWVIAQHIVLACAIHIQMALQYSQEFATSELEVFGVRLPQIPYEFNPVGD